MGAFSSIARSLGDLGSDFGTARANADQVNQQRQAFAQQQAAQKIKDVMTGLQILELQQRMQQQQQAAQLQTPDGQKNYLKSLLGRDPTEDEVARYLKIAPPSAPTRLPTAATYVDPATKQPFTGSMSADGIINVDTKKVIPGAIKWEKPEKPESDKPTTKTFGGYEWQYDPDKKVSGDRDKTGQYVQLGPAKQAGGEGAGEKTPFELWKKDNPKGTYDQWMNASKQQDRSDAVKSYQNAISAVTRYRNAKVSSQKIGQSSHWYSPGTWGSGDVANANLEGVRNDAEAMRQDAITKLTDAGMPVPDWLTKPIDEEANIPPPNVPPPPGFVPTRP